MISNALFITAVGMGGVFAFLILLTLAITFLHLFIENDTASDLEKIAVAIAVAKHQE
jgi:Na+-transporting methylmalonyl-CoA/oxaloacetate decarboxylase gamma subunit